MKVIRTAVAVWIAWWAVNKVKRSGRSFGVVDIGLVMFAGFLAAKVCPKTYREHVKQLMHKLYDKLVGWA